MKPEGPPRVFAPLHGTVGSGWRNGFGTACGAGIEGVRRAAVRAPGRETGRSSGAVAETVKHDPRSPSSWSTRARGDANRIQGWALDECPDGPMRGSGVIARVQEPSSRSSSHTAQAALRSVLGNASTAIAFHPFRQCRVGTNGERAPSCSALSNNTSLIEAICLPQKPSDLDLIEARDVAGRRVPAPTTSPTT